MDQNPDAVDQEEMAFAETKAPQSDPGDENAVVGHNGEKTPDKIIGSNEVYPSDTPPSKPLTPPGDYAEIADLMMQLQKRHSRNIFDNVSMRWWMRMQEICRTHS